MPDPHAIDAATFTVEIAGQPLDRVDHELVRITVDQNVLAPALCLVELVGRELRVPFQVGDEVHVEAAQERRTTVLFDGEVTGVDVEIDGTATRLIARCYDRGHRLQRGSRTRSFAEMTYSAIVSAVASEARVKTGRVTSTPVVHTRVIQANLDDWTFLQHLAARLGWICAMEEDRLAFHPVGPPPGTRPTEIDRWRDAIIWIRAGMSSAQVVDQVEVRGWDEDQQKALVRRASSEDLSAPDGPDLSAVLTRFAPHRAVATPCVLATLDEVDEAAQGLAYRVGGTQAEIEAEMPGISSLGAGDLVELASFGDLLDGQYVLSAVRHVWDEIVGYRTKFTVSDRQDRSLLGLTTGAGASVANRVDGLVPALVSNVDDDLGLDRVKLALPWLDDHVETGWARTVQLGAGPDRGSRFVPEVGDEVLVGFEQGDINRPYVLGGLYSPARQPYDKLDGTVVSDGMVQHRVFSSRTGQRIVLTDTAAEAGVRVITGDNATKVIIGGRDRGVTIITEDSVKLVAEKEITIEAGERLSLKGQHVTVEAEQGVAIKGGGDVSIDGVQVSVSGSGLALSASGTATLSGANGRDQLMSMLPVLRDRNHATDHIGAGWACPARIEQGRVALVRGDQEIAQSIYLILATARGERPMRPEFGCRIHDLVFEPIDATTEGRVRQAVLEALDRWEPRIENVSVEVMIDPRERRQSDPETALYINVSYVIRATNSPRNLVFPFYTIVEES